MHGRPYLTNDAAADPQIVPAMRDAFGVRSALGTPIFDRRGGVLGFVALYNKHDPGGFTPIDQDIAVAISQVAAVALQNALADQRLQQAEAAYAAVVQQLQSTEAQLDITREELQTMTEELRAANDQLQELNAELLASNVELNRLNRELMGRTSPPAPPYRCWK